MEALLAARVELSKSIEGGNAACEDRLRSTSTIPCYNIPISLTPALGSRYDFTASVSVCGGGGDTELILTCES